MRCMLNTGRTTDQGVALEIGKTSQAYYAATAIAFLSQDDMEELDLQEDDRIGISTEAGTIVVRCRKGWIEKGQIFMPLGPWANAIVGRDTSSTGMPSYKGVMVDVRKAQKEPTTLSDLFVDRERMDQALKTIPRHVFDEATAGVQPQTGEKRVVSDVVCPFCGCMCDDVEIAFQDDRLTDIVVGCELCKSRFLNWNKDRVRPAVMKDGRLVEATMDEALQVAAGILKAADFPLIYGLSSTEVDAQRKAIELAELIGATIDNTTSVCHGPTILAAQDCGVPELTLGEVRNRADLVIYWGCNPAEAHIRHVARYATTPKGMFTKGGRKDRFVVHVDVRETRTAKVDPRWHSTYQLADMLVKVRPGQDYELFAALRARLRGHDVGDAAGISSKTIAELAEMMKGCRFGVIFFGLGLTMSKGRHMNIDAVLRLVRDLNKHTKFAILPMRGHYNVAGANHVMLWTTGYPYAVNFSRGYPVYNPGEFTAVDLLARKECDAALIIASDPVAHFPRQAVEHLAAIPTIVMDPKVNMTSLVADVLLPTAIAGIECEGTAYRMDGVPVRLRKVVESGSESDQAVLDKLVERVRA